ncbi:MAG: hypothetical protein QOJ49_459, partial [Actinomycetota bacterium]|nr:hypothetical protein [Actinomycetota bacterium]
GQVRTTSGTAPIFRLGVTPGSKPGRPDGVQQRLDDGHRTARHVPQPAQ